MEVNYLTVKYHNGKLVFLFSFKKNRKLQKMHSMATIHNSDAGDEGSAPYEQSHHIDRQSNNFWFIYFIKLMIW